MRTAVGLALFIALVGPSNVRGQKTESIVFAAYLNEAIFVAGRDWVFSDGCYEGIGGAQVTTAPSHGTVSLAVGNIYTPDSCINGLEPGVVIYYTWTDAAPAATGQDSFVVRLTEPAGGTVTVDLQFTATLNGTQPYKTTGTGCIGEPQCGNPISIATGNKFEAISDYQTTGANPLGFTRYYNSGANPSTFAASLGSHWRSTYDRYLRIASATSVSAEREDGQVLSFASNAGTWSSDSDIDRKLTQSGSTWTLTDSSDTIETYSTVSASEARLTLIQARNGYMQTVSYNAGGQLTAVTDSYNRTLTFTYQSGLLHTVTTPDNLILTYGFNSSGITAGVLDRLASVAYSTSPVTSQTYIYGNLNLPFALTSVTDEDGHSYAAWTYDSQGRGLTSQHGTGADLTTIAYDDTTGNRTVTNALGGEELYKFTILQGVPKVTEIDRVATASVPAAIRTFTYDANGYVSSQTDWNGNQTNYVNDIHGQPTTINEAVRTPQARTTTITYHPTFHLPVTTEEPGITTTFTYDSGGNLLTRTATDTTTTTAPYSTDGMSRTWTFTWSNFLPASAQGPRTDVKELTQFTYDTSGALTAVTNALNQTTKITAHSPGGLPQTVVDPNGVTTQLAYDARLRLLSSTLTTSAGPLVTKYAYDAAGNLLTVTLPDDSAQTNSYDTAHRLTGIADLFNQKIGYTLDALGDRTQTSVLDVNGVQQRKHSGAFDSLGRLLQDIGGVGQTTGYVYDGNGNVVTIIDPLTHATQQTFDVLNRAIKTTDPNKGFSTTGYDAHDRPTSVTDPNGGTTTYVYDGFGDVIDQVSPAAGTTVYRYDLAGNLMQKVDATGATANYAYDALDRPVSVTYPADSPENFTFTYDQSGHGFGIGRLTSVADAVGTLSRSYDERGNLLTETRTVGGASLATSYGYDAASRVASITYPSGWMVNYTRDVMGRITAVTAKAKGPAITTSVLSGITYQPFGPVKGQSFGSGIAETRSFDADYRLTKLAATGNKALQNLTYGYDLANNVTSIADAATSANSQTFGYDPLNRLTSAAGGYGSLGYTYDANGNRQTENPSALPGTAASLDGLGSVSALAYNQAGRLFSVTAGSQTLTQYAYDAFGHRLMKSGTLTGTTLFQYDSAGHLLEESDGQGNPKSDYVYLDGRPVAEITPSSGKIYFLHDDRLGTPQAATDSTQATFWMANYLPFGGLPALPYSLTQDLRLPGQEFDLETGLYHNGFRDYVPAFGRYAQSDPIGLAGGLNTYAYVGNNPITSIDPSGLLTLVTTTTGLTFPVSTALEFVDLIQWLGPGSIQEITFAGHGGQFHQGIGDESPSFEVIQIDPSGDPIVSGRSLKGDARQNISLASLLNGKLAPGSQINFEGCHAGSEATSSGNPIGDNIARTTSRAILNVPVSGSSFYTFGPDDVSSHNYHILFFLNTYLSGRLQ